MEAVGEAEMQPRIRERAVSSSSVFVMVKSESLWCCGSYFWPHSDSEGSFQAINI